MKRIYRERATQVGKYHDNIIPSNEPPREVPVLPAIATFLKLLYAWRAVPRWVTADNISVIIYAVAGFMTCRGFASKVG
jgi:hypothetical protein